MAETITITTDELQYLLTWAVQNNEHSSKLYDYLHHILHNHERGGSE